MTPMNIRRKRIIILAVMIPLLVALALIIAVTHPLISEVYVIAFGIIMTIIIIFYPEWLGRHKR